jgi:hypothetical protein
MVKAGYDTSRGCGQAIVYASGEGWQYEDPCGGQRGYLCDLCRIYGPPPHRGRYEAAKQQAEYLHTLVSRVNELLGAADCRVAERVDVNLNEAERLLECVEIIDSSIFNSRLSVRPN